MKRVFKKKCKKGFTVAELLIVVAIIGVLVAIMIPIINRQMEKSREAYDIYTMRQAASAAIDLYYMGIEDSKSAAKAGLSWWGVQGSANSNAWGAYDPESGKFYPKKTDVQPYGKGTAVNGGTQFELGNTRGAYGPDEDYTDGIVMIAIYPFASNKHVDIYWKNRNKNDSYIGGAAGTSDPKYSIRIPFD